MPTIDSAGLPEGAHVHMYTDITGLPCSTHRWTCPTLQLGMRSLCSYAAAMTPALAGRGLLESIAKWVQSHFCVQQAGVPNPVLAIDRVGTISILM
jgi:hypothetical protein